MPKHGYRFIAPVEAMEPPLERPGAAPLRRWRQSLVLAAAGTAGGAVAGLLGGFFYGFAAAGFAYLAMYMSTGSF